VCVGGPKVAINYSGLIEAPRNVRCEDITGHSAVVVWNAGWCRGVTMTVS